MPSTNGKFSIKELFYDKAVIFKGSTYEGTPELKISLRMRGAVKNSGIINGINPLVIVDLCEELNNRNNVVIDLNIHKRFTEMPEFIQHKLIDATGITLMSHLNEVVEFFIKNAIPNMPLPVVVENILKKDAFKVLNKKNLNAFFELQYVYIPNHEEVATVWSKTLYFPYKQLEGVHQLTFFKHLINNYNKQCE